MNNIIKKLAEKAGVTKIHQRSDGMYVVGEPVLEKFAELICKDIITVVAAQALMNESALDVFKNLKRIYQGVEE